ncbi:tRNA (adenosine(37)-N6)-threonylcarbamoyltransferase complex dimerization subunit type 1 TsaB [bacterium]|nr:tRNA (adenosine(37)-N6)-threonylcarbamoyltransferase complex dimerization subunit type 1 TsaB [bacterium]
MNYFLALQHTYESIEIALFEITNTFESRCIAKVVEDKKKASKNIVALADKLLQDNNVFFDDLLFFAANQGPGPFTTLRVVIASANGLAFAAQKKLIGIDGLDALLEEGQSNQRSKSFDKNITNVTVALLNAFSGDVYFGIKEEKNLKAEKGYEEISILLNRLQKKFPNQNIKFIGQGVLLYEKEIKKVFGKYADIPKNFLNHASIKTIGFIALEKWQQQKGLTNQLLPLYLKTMKIHKKA